MAHEGKKKMMARVLRRRSTASERKLWTYIRGHRFLGLQFDRQQPIGPYIVDFYCSTCRLVVELDGLSHCYRRASDRARQKYLEEQGLTVVRFTNDVVMNSIGLVLNELLQRCSAHVEIPQ